MRAAALALAQPQLYYLGLLRSHAESGRFGLSPAPVLLL